MRSRPMIPLVLSLVGTTWCDYRIGFDVAAPTPDSATTLYGVRAEANFSSRASVLVRDSSLVLEVDTIASNSAARFGYDGYTADVGARIPVRTASCSYDLRAVEAITFEYRSSQPITDRLAVQLESDVYPSAAFAVGARLEASVAGAEKLAAGGWRTATLRRADFAAPKGAEAIEGMPALDSVLRYLEGLRISPRTTYTQPGTTREGGPCTDCTDPTMTKQTLEIRNLTLKMASSGFKVSTLPGRWGYAYNQSSSDTTQLRAMYGIRAFSNAASRTVLSMENGTVVLRDTLASDSGDAGRIGYSARAGVFLPVRYDGLPVDAGRLEGTELEFRNSERITDGLAVQLVSDVYPDSLFRIGAVYELVIRGQSLLAAGTSWKSGTLRTADFAIPDWLKDAEGLPPLPKVLANLRGLRFVPMSAYSDSGTFLGSACARCATPTMKTQTLELRWIRMDLGDVDFRIDPGCADVGTPTGVVHGLQSVRFAASYGNGRLTVENVPGYARIEVVSASGRRIAAFDADAAAVDVQLETGTWYVVARGPGKPVLVRSLAVAR